MSASENGRRSNSDRRVTTSSTASCQAVGEANDDGPLGTRTCRVGADDIKVSDGFRSHCLPDYPRVCSMPTQWGEKSGEIVRLFDKAYRMIVHWRANTFRVPSGKVGKMLVAEMNRVLVQWETWNPLEGVAIKAAMCMPALLLQVPHSKARKADQIVCLKRRLELWHKGDVESLLHECVTIQTRLKDTRNHSLNGGQHASLFARKVQQGNVKAAIRMISKNGFTGVLQTDSIQQDDRSVKHHLEDIYPDRRPLQESVLKEDPGSSQPHQVIYDKIPAQMIRSIVLKMTGSAGPSGLDTNRWKRICSSFSRESDDLCSTIARMTRHLCNEYVDPEGVSCLLACRLIALDKSPGVRPIGVCEVLRRIMAKAALQVTSDYIFEVTGPLQLCTGHISGCEAWAHSMRCLYNDTNTEAILMTDATNAFNSLNRAMALRNIQVMCPPVAPFLVNTYQCDVSLYVDGETLLSI